METPAGQKILIAGGTSGLGLELVKLFHEQGFDVICTGRHLNNFRGYAGNFRFFRADFSSLAETAEVFTNICNTIKPDFIINNAGILSPPDLTMTGDGFEYSFQVNFLAHFLVNEIIVRNNTDNHPLRICTITSPVFKMANIFPDLEYNVQNYRPLKAYSDSKLFLALMCRHLEEEYPDKNISSFSINPGVFSSSIYRTQGGLFRLLYRIAAPLMRHPAKVAGSIFEMMINPAFSGGKIYNIRKISENMPAFNQNLTNVFWVRINEIAKQYLKP